MRNPEKHPVGSPSVVTPVTTTVVVRTVMVIITKVGMS
jgi:hypothetical protein